MGSGLLTKFVWSRRLDISFVLFLAFLWFDKACNIYIYTQLGIF